jgi:hypothetical protein
MNETLELNPLGGSPFINPVAHEIGHGFGLGDPPRGTQQCVNSVMSGYSADQPCGTDRPTSCDWKVSNNFGGYQ